MPLRWIFQNWRRRAMTKLSTEVIEKFEATLRGPLLRPGEPEYDRVRAIWNAMIDKHPGLIAHCEGTADVMAAVAFARDNDQPLAIRAGGHNIAGNALC